MDDANIVALAKPGILPAGVGLSFSYRPAVFTVEYKTIPPLIYFRSRVIGSKATIFALSFDLNTDENLYSGSLIRIMGLYALTREVNDDPTKININLFAPVQWLQDGSGDGRADGIACIV
jgi:hypothetical protein